MSAFARNLKRIREAQGMTITALAKELKLSIATVSLYEKGEREPSLSKVQRLANIFNVTVNELFEGMDDDQDSKMAMFLQQYEKAKARWESCDFRIKEGDGGYITITPDFDVFLQNDTPMYALELKKADFVKLTKEIENHILLYRKKEEEFKLMTRVIMSEQAARRRINPHNLVGEYL